METAGGDGAPLIPSFQTELADVCYRLNKAGARYVLVGARAVQLWGSARATRDIDILIEPTEPNAARVLDALGTTGFGSAREWFAHEIVAKPVTILGDFPRVDILTVAWTVTFDRAEPSKLVRRIAGVRVPYLGLEDLLRSKQTGRPGDLADIEVLRGVVGRKPGRIRRKRPPPTRD